jgi:argininosuccinate synthase
MSNGPVVLAYSGGLDTTVIVHRIKAELGRDVIAVLVDVGQGEDLSAAAERGLRAGAADAVIVDAKERFVADVLTPAIAANALYEGKYPLVSALSRPLIAQICVEQARAKGATAVAHGCTGKGNDQVRFEVAFGALAPDLEVLAPIRQWAMSRPEAIEYATKHGVDIGWITAEKSYSIDQNLWGRTIEGGILEDPWNGVPDDAWELTRPTGSPGETIIGFEAGLPVSADGERVGPAGVVAHLNKLAGGVGYGRVDMIENRRVGIKSREIYEVPGALAVLAAHRDLEDLTLERDLARDKARLDLRWAELIYDGLWFSPLRASLDAFMRESQAPVTGEVRLAFADGNLAITGRRSDNALYRADLATYDADDAFDHDAARGFVQLWGLPTKVWSAASQRAGSTSTPGASTP